MKLPQDIFTEPDHSDDTLANLGPLRRLAGAWRGMDRGTDVNPKADGPEHNRYFERVNFQVLDPQLNGPQILYPMWYEMRVIKQGEPGMFHHQVGHWIWEPATQTITQTLSIPRGQVVIASGQAMPNADSFELNATRGSAVHGISDTPFLDAAFKTLSYRLVVRFHRNGTWSYESDTVLRVRGQAEPFHHTDRNTLRRVRQPKSNSRVTGESFFDV